MNSRIQKLILVFLLFITGIVCLPVAFMIRLDTNKKIESYTAKTTGTVTKKYSSAEFKTSCSAGEGEFLVQYPVPPGQSNLTTKCHPIDRFHIGDQVPVIYDLSEPTNAMLDIEEEKTGFVEVLAIALGCFIGSGILLKYGDKLFAAADLFRIGKSWNN